MSTLFTVTAKSRVEETDRHSSCVCPRNPDLRGRIRTLDLLVPTSSYKLLLMLKRYFISFLQNKLSWRGGQLYGALPFSEDSLVCPSTYFFKETFASHLKCVTFLTRPDRFAFNTIVSPKAGTTKLIILLTWLLFCFNSLMETLCSSFSLYSYQLAGLNSWS
jgi:hypothetical protein